MVKKKVAGLQKKGPKKRKSKSNKGQRLDNKLPTLDDLQEDKEFDEFERMMKDSPSYRRHNGALRSVR